jgi:hypothetical protein
LLGSIFGPISATAGVKVYFAAPQCPDLVELSPA